MPSPYPVLNDKPIDQWKVTELKEELKRRRLITRGLKEELIRRLDEALRNEMEVANEEELGNGPDRNSDPEDNLMKVEVEKIAAVNSEIHVDQNENNVKDATLIDVDNNTPDISQGIKAQDMEAVEKVAANLLAMENNVTDIGSDITQFEPSGQGSRCEEKREDSTLTISLLEPKNQVSEVSHDLGFQVKCESNSTDFMSINEKNKLKDNLNADNLNLELEVGHVLPVGGDLHHLADEQEECKDQVSVEEVDAKHATNVETFKKEDVGDGGSLEKSDLERGSASELMEDVKIEIKHIESNIKPDEFEESIEANKFKLLEEGSLINNVAGGFSPDKKDIVVEEEVGLTAPVEERKLQAGNILPFGGDLYPLDDEQEDKNRVPQEEIDAKVAVSVELIKKEYSGDGVSAEKLNLDRSSGDESMEEDVLESKHVKHDVKADVVGEMTEAKKVDSGREGNVIDAVAGGFSSNKKDIVGEQETGPTAPIEKRKIKDHETLGSNETSKRQRRWNPDNLKVPELHTSNFTTLSTPKDAFQPTPKRQFTRSDSTLSGDSPKERIVPPSQKPATTSLRIDRFLRPFTLKAVQELLAKTGTVCNFWMDHIKTHCFVTYSTVEEAMETRNAVYNLQWPPNGGRLLVADFVDPQEVKLRAEAPPQSPASITPTTPTAPALQQNQDPKPTRQNSLRQQQQLPPPPLLPSPALSSQPPVREQALPPPPPLPLPKQPELAGQTLTLDDLFKKTRATPRIYYLPLSEDQVAAKRSSAQGEGARV